MRKLILKYVKKFASKYIGSLEYVVTIVNVNGEVVRNFCKNIKEVDAFVIEINGETYYDVQKIEKFRRYSFKYNKKVLHTPLWFEYDNVTEMYNCDNMEYSFLKIDESLTNVIRSHRKNLKTEEKDAGGFPTEDTII